MKAISQNTAFHLGSWLGTLLMIGLNVYDFVISYEGWDQYGTFGVPFSIKDGGKLFDDIIWLGLFAYILFAFVFSLVLGTLFRFVW